AEMVTTGAFKVICLPYVFAMVAGMMAIGHIAAFVEDCGYSTIQAAFGITILSIFNGIGRVAAGSISDRIGRKSVLIILFFIIGLAVFLFNMELTLYLIYLNAAIIGFCFGGFLAVYPPLTADYFGAKNFGVNYGLVFVGYGAGCFVGPWLGGYIYDISGLYRWAFSLAGGLAIMGGIIIYFLLKSQELKKEVVT
ncbi:MFS transporter, partial [Caldithrix abyssi]